MKIEELFRIPAGGALAVKPEMDPLTEDIALMESQLLDVRFEAVTSTVGLLFDLRYVMSADGAEMKRVTHDSAVYDSPAWSPDGSNIVCCRYEGDGKYICVMNADGSDQRAVTSPVGAHDYDPSWGPS